MSTRSRRSSSRSQSGNRRSQSQPPLRGLSQSRGSTANSRGSGPDAFERIAQEAREAVEEERRQSRRGVQQAQPDSESEDEDSSDDDESTSTRTSGGTSTGTSMGEVEDVRPTLQELPQAQAKAALRDIAGVLVGRETPLHLLRPQRHDDGLPQQIGGAGDGRAASSHEQTSRQDRVRGRQHPGHEISK